MSRHCPLSFGGCQHLIRVPFVLQRVYPGRAFHAIYDTNTPEIFLVVVSLTFVVMVMVFVVYDLLVQRRNNKLILNAAQSSAIVSSMFPSQFRDRLMGDGTGENNGGTQTLKTYMKNGAKSRGAGGQESKPLADLFLETTLIFADIVGELRRSDNAFCSVP